MRLGYGCTIQNHKFACACDFCPLFASLLDASAFAEQKTRQTFDTACGRRSRRQRRETPAISFSNIFLLESCWQLGNSVLPSSTPSPPTTGLIFLSGLRCAPGSRRRHTGEFKRVFERRRNGCCSRAVVIRAVPVLLDTGLVRPIVAPPPTTPNACRSARLLLLRTRSGLGCRSSLDRTEETGRRFRLLDRIGPKFHFSFLFGWGLEFPFYAPGKGSSAELWAPCLEDLTFTGEKDERKQTDNVCLNPLKQEAKNLTVKSIFWKRKPFFLPCPLVLYKRGHAV